MFMKKGSSSTGHMMPMKGEPGAMMPHEMPMKDPDSVFNTENFKKTATHPDSKGSAGMHGDGKGHFSGH